MTKAKHRMTKECRRPNDQSLSRVFRTASRFVLRHSSFFLLFSALTLDAADNISILGSKPKWSVLDHYQETITHGEFANLIYNVYCTHGFAPDLIEINEKTARI